MSPRGSCSCTTKSPTHQALANQKKLTYLGFQYLDHPPHSPDLSPSHYHLFPGLKKKQSKVRHFSSEAEVIAAVETWLDGQTSVFFLSGFQKLEQRAKQCIEPRGDYYLLLLLLLLLLLFTAIEFSLGGSSPYTSNNSE